MCGTYLVLKVLCVFEEPQTLRLRGRQSAGGENDISVPTLECVSVIHTLILTHLLGYVVERSQGQLRCHHRLGL